MTILSEIDCLIEDAPKPDAILIPCRIVESVAVPPNMILLADIGAIVNKVNEGQSWDTAVQNRAVKMRMAE